MVHHGTRGQNAYIATATAVSWLFLVGGDATGDHTTVQLVWRKWRRPLCRLHRFVAFVVFGHVRRCFSFVVSSPSSLCDLSFLVASAPSSGSSLRCLSLLVAMRELAQYVFWPYVCVARCESTPSACATRCSVALFDFPPSRGIAPFELLPRES